MGSERQAREGRAPLTVESLIDAVCERSGGLEFRDLGFVPALEQVLAVPTRLEFSRGGLGMLRGNLERCLLNRLRYQADLAAHPEILEEDVSDPIVILGLPRSGTTKLQRILSADPAVQPTYTWGMFNPAPFPGEPPGDPSQRIAWAAAMATSVAQAGPEFNRIHEYDAVAAEETCYLLLANFDTVLQWLTAPCPVFLEWARSVDRRSPLTYVKEMLQYLQWQAGGRRGPYLIKCPAHTGEMAEFLDVFPKASFVLCRRDLGVTMASTVRMMCEIISGAFGKLDLHDYGLGLLEYWSYELQRFLRQWEELGERVRVLDVSYGQVVEDPFEVGRQAFRLHGLTPTEEGLRAMREVDRQYPAGKFGKFRYDLADYGLGEADVERAFGDVYAQWRGL